eukprot:863197-Rhodomonas_salina.1
MWSCVEAFPAEQAGLAANVTYGYRAGVFCTRQCYFFRANANSVSRWEDLPHEDVCFHTIQADAGWLLYLATQ